MYIERSDIVLYKISGIIIQKMIKLNYIEIDEAEIYKFGLLLYGKKIIHITLMLLISCIFNQLIDGVLFLIFYSILRSYAGGYHATKDKYCIIISCFVMLISMFFIKSMIFIGSKVLYFLFLVVASSIIYVLAPVDSISKPLNKIEIFEYKKKSHIYLLSIFITSIILNLINSNYCYTIGVVVYVESAMLLLGTKRSPRFSYK